MCYECAETVQKLSFRHKMTVALLQAEPETVAKLRAKLLDPNTNLPEKYRVLFSLRNLAGQEAHEALLTALKDESALFRHDVAFCLGQRQDAAAIDTLKAILNDPREHAMVRHEAGEALGAIGTEECLVPLREHLQDTVQEVAETCQLALQRIQDLSAVAGKADKPANDESPYYSVDPTPALPASTPTEELRAKLLNEKLPMFERYSALFALRNKGGVEAVRALGDAFTHCSSALLKHEVAYVMGQMQDPTSAAILTDVLKNGSEHAMVRHEAAEALGSIADDATIKLLKDFAVDPEPIVAHSCVVALDMMEFEKSGAFEYADKGTDGEPAPRKACMC